jgi:response regulator RpfG family c-di-GMP phosphodiesterase
VRLLLVDDDPGLRALVRATFDEASFEIVDAASAAAAEEAIDVNAPDVIVLDVAMPGESGVDLCRRLKSTPATADIPVLMLSGAESEECGADAFLKKPFSPLQLIAVVERLAGSRRSVPLVQAPGLGHDEQLLLYARDLRHLFELERAQRRVIQEAYGATVGALAEALATKDTGTRAHSRRVQRYAVELMRAVEPDLAGDVSIEYGFVLHDVGKIGISDRILQKPGPLSPEERRVMEQHPVLGYDMLRDVTFLQGDGLSVVRSHHERWDGSGYPDNLAGTEIPLAARIFSVADALDAMTTERPYRLARPWRDARAEIVRESGGQFDPHVVAAFVDCEPRLQQVQRSLVAA